MSFEAREKFLGLPISRWKTVTGLGVERIYDGYEGIFARRSGQTLSVQITEAISPDGNALTVSSTRRVADSWSTFRDDKSVQTVRAGTPEKARVFLPTPGHYVLYQSTSSTER